MSNYVVTTDFAAKDALTTGNPLKKAKGTELDTELDNIATAISTKEDLANKGTNNGYAGLDGSGKVLVASLPSATDSAIGAVELATTTEANTGTDTNRAVTPAGVKAAIDGYAAGLFPTKAGSGATGTWSISVSGSAASATTAGDADTVDGQHAAAFAAASHSHAGSAITSGTVSASYLPKIGSLSGITIASDPGGTPSGSAGDMFFYY